MDIPLDDPEANKAAAKIQAGFRGHMTRKKLKPGDKPGEEVSSTGETLNGSQGDAGQWLSPVSVAYRLRTRISYVVQTLQSFLLTPEDTYQNLK